MCASGFSVCVHLDFFVICLSSQVWIHFEVTLGVWSVYLHHLFFVVHIMSAGATSGNTLSPSSLSAQEW